VAKAVYTTKRGLTVGIARLGSRKDGRGSGGQEVHDGDTVTVDPLGNLGFRFLGVDAPEVSFTLPASNQGDGGSEPIDGTFVDIDDPRWGKRRTRGRGVIHFYDHPEHSGRVLARLSRISSGYCVPGRYYTRARFQVLSGSAKRYTFTLNLAAGCAA
jgi:hypothetical protein